MPAGGLAPTSSPDAPSLETLVAEARAASPGVELPDAVFRAYLAEKLTDMGERSLNAATRLRVAELYLACACVHHDPVALALFERRYFGEVDAVWRRFDALPLSLDDVRQRLRERLFLAEPPGLRGYAGLGALQSWLRAAALHMLLNVASRESREQPTDEAFFHAVVDASAGAEAAYLKQACRIEFQEAFVCAMGRLSARDRSLLRYAYADGLSVDQIGVVFHVHRATAARWVAKARVRLVSETRSELMERLRIGDVEAASIVRAALSRMGSTLLRRLDAP